MEMGCFGRPWHTFVQRNVQRQEFCASANPLVFDRLFQPLAGRKTRYACPIAISGFDDGEEHFDVDDP
jgi:hypothetical protein